MGKKNHQNHQNLFSLCVSEACGITGWEGQSVLYPFKVHYWLGQSNLSNNSLIFPVSDSGIYSPVQINGISWASKLLALLKSRILTAPLTSCPLKTRDIFRKLFANQILPTSVERTFSVCFISKCYSCFSNSIETFPFTCSPCLCPCLGALWDCEEQRGSWNCKTQL